MAHHRADQRRLFGALVAAVVVGTLSLPAAPAVASGSAGTPLPRITAVEGSPSLSTGGDVVIHGSHLGHIRSIHFGRKPAHHYSGSGTTIYVTAPTHGPGSARITVTTRSGTSQPAPFRYLRPNPLTFTKSKPFHPWGGEIADLSCAGPSFCAAIDRTSVATFDGSSWATPVQLDRTEGLRAVACGSPTSCLVAGLDGETWTFDGAAWTAAAPAAASVVAASCPTESSCIAISRHRAMTMQDGSWTTSLHVAKGVLSDVSCPTTEFCVATGAPATQVYTYDGSVWTSTALPAVRAVSVTTSVDCTSAEFCAAVDDGGNVYTFDGAWSSPSQVFASGNARHVACASPTDCVALDLWGDASHWDGHDWTQGSPVDTSPDAPVHGRVFAAGLACIPDASCYYGESAGEVVPFDGSTWGTPVPVITPTSWPTSVSCWAAGHCMESDDAASVQTLDGTSWGRPHNVVRVERTGSQVSCVSATFCVLVAGNGRAATFDGASWTESVPLSDVALVSVSCASTDHCMALDEHGAAYRLDASGWSAAIPTGLADAAVISCPSDQSCVAAGGVDATRWNGTAWTTPTTVDPSQHPATTIGALSCPTASFCVFGDTQGYAGVYSHGRWEAPTPTGLRDELRSTSCTGASFCVSSSYLSSLTTFDGSDWSDPVRVLPLPPAGDDWLAATSCATPTFCVSVGWHVAAVIR